jgi:hypothetical protein
LKLSLLLLSGILLIGKASAGDAPDVIGPEGCKVINPHPVEHERISWNGGCKDGYADGSGVLIWYLNDKETIRYEGDVRQGQPHGQIYSIDLNGNQYEGAYLAGKKEGKGIWMENDGTRYEGEFKDDYFSGHGSIAYAEGGRYTGQWKHGKFHGSGKAVYIGGQVAEGEFVDGLRAGQTRVPASKDKIHYLAKDLRSSRVKAPEALTGTGIPFDKSYPSMTPVEQQAVRDSYILLHERDEPPFPLIGLGQVIHKFTELAVEDTRRGRVDLRLRIGVDGKATSYIVVASPSPQLADAITSILMAEKFKPGRYNGVPCAMLYKFSVSVD